MTHTASELNKPPRRSFGRAALDWIKSFLTALAFVFLLSVFVFQLSGVDGPSMMNTLKDGERMLVTKYQYLFGDPDRFDVVTCHYPTMGNETFVKRVVAIPGDTVSVRDGVLYVNAEPVDEPYVDYPPDYWLRDIALGDDQYFVLGDNRSNSTDSHILGPIDRRQIVGQVRAVLWPLDEMRAIH